MSIEYQRFRSVGVDGSEQIVRARSNGSAVGDAFLGAFARAVEHGNRRDAEVRRLCREAGARYVAPLDGWTRWPGKDRDCDRARGRGRHVPMPETCTQALAYSRPGTEMAGDMVAIVETRGLSGPVWMTLYRIACVDRSPWFGDLPPDLHLERVQPPTRLDL